MVLLIVSIIYALITLSVMSYLVYRFVSNIIKYGYMGNTKIYVGTCLVMCLSYSLFVSIRPAAGVVDITLLFPKILNSVFDSL